MDVKQNFKNQNQNPWCTSCGLFQESQGHILQCLSGRTAKLDEHLVYGSIEQQRVIVNIYSDILEVRENLQQNNNET